MQAQATLQDSGRGASIAPHSAGWSGSNPVPSFSHFLFSRVLLHPCTIGRILGLVSANPSTASAAEWWWWWWWKSDILDLFFFFAILSAATHAAVNASGGISASQKTAFAVSLLFGWFVIVTLRATAASAFNNLGGRCDNLKSIAETAQA